MFPSFPIIPQQFTIEIIATIVAVGRSAMQNSTADKKKPPLGCATGFHYSGIGSL